MTETQPLVEASPAARRACCDAFDAALAAERIVVGDDPSTHAEVTGMLAALPYVLRDELARLWDEAAERSRTYVGHDGRTGDGAPDPEVLHDLVLARMEALEAAVALQEAP